MDFLQNGERKDIRLLTTYFKPQESGQAKKVRQTQRTKIGTAIRQKIKMLQNGLSVLHCQWM